MKRLFLLIIFFLNFSVVSAQADQQITNTTLPGDNSKLNIVVPPDLMPGYHSMSVEATDPVTGKTSTDVIFFCKDLEGTIHWENVCGEITPLASQATLEKTVDRSQLPGYDPLSQPKKTFQTEVAAFAALTVLAAGGVAGALGGGGSLAGGGHMNGENRYGRREDPSELDMSLGELTEKPRGEATQEQDLASIDSDHLRKVERKAGRGDSLGTWNVPLTPIIDSVFIAGAHKSSLYSPTLSRIFYDGNYLRAMLGSFAAILHPVGLILGFVALKGVGAQALPPQWVVFTAIVLLGVFDAFAGFLAAGIFFAGTLLTGNLGSRDELLTVVGTIGIFFAPALIASAYRPLRREVSTFAEKWERLTDYLLASVLTGWTVSKMVGSLESLAGVQLPTTAYAFSIGAWSAVAVFIRLVGEDIATYVYPRRLAELHPELREPRRAQTWFSLIFNTGVFIFLAEPFIGNSIQLWLGVMLFVFPKIMSMTATHKLPRSKTVYKLLPKGALKLVVMVLIGSLFARWMQTLIPNPQEYVKWGFVLLGVPSLVFQIASFFGDRSLSTSWKVAGMGKYVYRFGGVIVFLLIVQLALGNNLLETLFRK
ncbi:MAG: hypothetical protein WC800_03275 [Candidatus Nanopelagicaceae bacterium]|jgi:hypothetical protein